MGELVVLDTAKGWHEADGIVHRIGHRGEPIKPVIRDDLVGDSWPKFLHPYPLSDKYFLAAVQPDAKSPWGIYLVDVFDNMRAAGRRSAVRFLRAAARCGRRPRRRSIPDRVDLARDDATVYLHNVYAGPGAGGRAAGSGQAAADRRLSLRLSGHGRTRQDRPRRARGR